MASRSELVIEDCGKCKKMTTQMERQSLGCGYEPRTDRVHLQLWQPPLGNKAYRGPEPTVCAGYSTSLPEVMEAFLARIHWEKGNMLALHKEPTEELLSSIVIIDSAFKSVERWAMTPASEGGGRH